jgi:hypothetical protein
LVPDNQRDEVICQILLREGKVHFNDLLKKVSLEYKSITRKVLSKTLDRMKNQHIIKRDDYPAESRGGKRNAWLTDDVKWLIRNELFEGLSYERSSAEDKDETKGKKITRAISLLLILAGAGTQRLEPLSKVGPGDVLVMEEKTGKSLTCRSSTKRGVSLDDISDRTTTDPLVQIAQNIKKDEIERAMKILKQEDFPILVPVNPSGNMTYDIHPDNEKMRNFLITSKNILSLIIWLLRRNWILSKKLERKQAKWYISLFGGAASTGFFSNIDRIRDYEFSLLRPFFERTLNEQKRTINKQSTRRLFQKQIKEDIRRISNILRLELQNFDAEYKEAETVHPRFCSIVKELVHPRFLEQMVKLDKSVYSLINC